MNNCRVLEHDETLAVQMLAWPRRFGVLKRMLLWLS